MGESSLILANNSERKQTNLADTCKKVKSRFVSDERGVIRSDKVLAITEAIATFCFEQTQQTPNCINKDLYLMWVKRHALRY